MNTSSFEKLASFCKSLRDSELRTVALLGCPMKIRKSRHFFQLEVTIRGHVDTEMPPESRISCKMVFMCPKFYPRSLPEVHIRSKKNFPDYLESVIYSEYDRMTHLDRGSQYIIPMVSSALYMIEREEQKRSERVVGESKWGVDEVEFNLTWDTFRWN